MDKNSKQIYFITGTDTNCGKTYCTVKLMHELQAQGKSVIGLKPIASGSEQTADGLRNDDALKLQAASTIDLPYDIINPITFKQPIAPHIEAQKHNYPLSVSHIIDKLQPGLAVDCDIILIEGAGGLMTPLNSKETLIDLIATLNISVIFVTGLKLGCLNHTLLSFEALRARNIPIHKHILNSIDPNFSHSEENIAYLFGVHSQVGNTHGYRPHTSICHFLE